jgi:hypothetical protein
MAQSIGYKQIKLVTATEMAMTMKTAMVSVMLVVAMLGRWQRQRWWHIAGVFYFLM